MENGNGKFWNSRHIKGLFPLVLFNYFLIEGQNKKHLFPCFKKKTLKICIYSQDPKQRSLKQEPSKIFPCFYPLFKVKLVHSQQTGGLTVTGIGHEESKHTDRHELNQSLPWPSCNAALPGMQLSSSSVYFRHN